jgi:hypothetical protein
MAGNSHPWRIMTAVFIGVLLVSFCIQKLFDPAGDFVAGLFGPKRAAPARSNISGLDRTAKAP